MNLVIYTSHYLREICVLENIWRSKINQTIHQSLFFLLFCKLPVRDIICLILDNLQIAYASNVNPVGFVRLPSFGSAHYVYNLEYI